MRNTALQFGEFELQISPDVGEQITVTGKFPMPLT